MEPPASVDPTADHDDPGSTLEPENVIDCLRQVTSALTRGETRDSQIEMCTSVASSISSGRHLVVQAGTGTGKSLAYIVPAILSGKRVVVATATKGLQDQLARKDFPLVANALKNSTSFTFSVLKGRSNYLCLQKATEIQDSGYQQSFNDDAPYIDDDLASVDHEISTSDTTLDPRGSSGLFGRHVRDLITWSKSTSSGDRAELHFEPHPKAWSMLSAGPNECPGKHDCPSGYECFAEKARELAEGCDVVIVNTHLYGAHLAVKLASDHSVLPPHEVVVFDEAHELEEVMTASLGVELSPGRFRALARIARGLLHEDPAPSVLQHVAEVGEQLRDLLLDSPGKRVLREPTSPGPSTRESSGREPDMREPSGREPDTREPSGREPDTREPDTREPSGRERLRELGPIAAGLDDEVPAGSGDPLPKSAHSNDSALAETLLLATSRVEALHSLLAVDSPDQRARDDPEFAARNKRALTAAGHLLEDLQRILSKKNDEVAWVDADARGPTLRLSPIDVGPYLADGLWGEVTSILTSATIPPKIRSKVGLSSSLVDELDVGSPFDYASHALLYVATHLPDRKEKSSAPAIVDELELLINAAGGRTLALFTSHRAVTEVAQALRPRLSYRLMTQGELPKTKLLSAFVDDESSCLFATLGFWQGVDVPGPSLTLVTLDRLPFPRPDDPLLQARRELADSNGVSAFHTVDIPRAATLLAQGVGRLIRSSDDTGVVAVLDPRLAKARYRGALLAGLPPMRRTTQQRQAVEFLKRCAQRQSV